MAYLAGGIEVYHVNDLYHLKMSYANDVKNMLDGIDNTKNLLAFINLLGIYDDPYANFLELLETPHNGVF